MNIDVKTLVILMGITNILQVIAVYIQYSINKIYKGIGWWLIGFICIGLGSGLIILREYLPNQAVNIFATNVLLLSGPVFHYIGVMRFLGKKESRILIIVVMSVLLVSFSFYFNDITVRSAIISSALSVMALFTAWSLFINRQRSIRVSAYFMFGLFLLQGAFFAFRAIDILFTSPLSNVFDPTALQVLAFLVPLIVGILLTFGLIIMVNQRLNSEMRQAKEHFELIFNTGPDATVISRLSDGCIININDGFTALSGLTRDEVVGRPSLDIWNDPADRQRMVKELGEKGYRENFEAIFRRKDGSRLFGSMSAKIIKLNDIPHIISITRDITESKRMAAEVRSLSLFPSENPNSVLRINEKGEILYANPASQFMLEYWHTKTGDYSIEPIYGWVKQALDKHVTLECEYSILDRIYSFEIIPVAQSGYVNVYVRDITRRKRAENAVIKEAAILQSTIDSTDAAIFSLDRDYKYLSFNKAHRYIMKNIYGADIVIDGSLPDYQTNLDDWTKAKINLDRALSGEGVLEQAYSGTLNRSYFEISHNPIRDPQGNVIGVTVFAQDLSERKRMEEALLGKNAELERFTYTVSHDLKSPLVTLKVFLGYLKNDIAASNTERIEKDMNFINTSTNRMGVMLDELLEMSRIGRVINSPEYVTFSELGQEALTLLAGRIGERGVKVNLQDGSLALFGDRSRLIEIWQNLIENSLKFMGEQPLPSIEIGHSEIEKEITFFVRDNGIGIDQRYQGKIFGLFEKLDKTTEGTGLGLAVVKRIVELYGGYIRVESEGQGKGTCFWFTLPRAIRK